ncbi:SWIB/MDM2 domain protein [Golovinomyces cichoracearum]|uniref:SWIB/MDM2 domain protein n=1 Tax=Golovinomyces cichoracearum TaxID=62708 RepID=A0A420HH15_9PEZI|nr:SWIB/MDM2 domain protein [Golovinomyces cichoracearum]
MRGKSITALEFLGCLSIVPLLPSERARYTELIDETFQGADLKTITAKQVRKALAAKLGKDISSQKDALQTLIIERFDLAANCTKIGSSVEEENSSGKSDGRDKKFYVTEPNKNKHESNEDFNASVIETDNNPSTSKRRKKVKKSKLPEGFDDEKYAKILQAEEDRGTRSTRRKSKVIKVSNEIAKKNSSKESQKKLKSSGNEVGTDDKLKEKDGKKSSGFHKKYHLSEPLADLLGETTLSRPQVVKNIWAYIKAQDLQDPTDKRQIICDERMQSVFKQDRVHMFTMNKILGNQLHDIEEE